MIPYDPTWKDRKEFPVEHHICLSCPSCHEIWFTNYNGKAYRCCVNPESCYEVAEKSPQGDIRNSWGTKTPLNCTMYFEYILFYDNTGDNKIP